VNGRVPVQRLTEQYGRRKRQARGVNGVTGICRRAVIAFSSEVDAGSRKENASKQTVEPGSDAI
jgi:hypothetical protein